jgi:hypothetical protein
MAVIKIVPMPGAKGAKGDEGETGSQGPQGETGLQGPAGADALWSYNGSWQSNASYAEGDIVTYEGQLYYAKSVTTAGTLPTDTAKFDLIASKGADGQAGLNGLEGDQGPAGADGVDGEQGEIGFPGFKYDTRRVLANQYVVGEIVEYQGQYFICIANNDAITPAVGEYWAAYSFVGPQGEPGLDGEDAVTVIETSFTVNGGTLGTQPTFNGAPLFSGSYVKTGPLVHFQIQVDMDNITSFGTGQYYVDLPFPAKYSYHFRDACLHDNSGTVRQYALSGHVYAGQSQVTLWFTSTSGQDELFDYNSPALLTVNDNFHIAGTYISE